MKKYFIFLVILILPFSIKAVTREEYNKAVLETSISATTTYTDEFVYSFFWGGTKDNPKNLKSSTTDVWLSRAKEGKTSSGYRYGFKNNPGVQGPFTNKFAVFCGTFVDLMIYHASGGVFTTSDYETIKVEELQPGELIHFNEPDPHIAVFVNNNNDSNPNTFTLAHATGGKAQYQTDVNRKADYGLRIKASSLFKLNDNLVNASSDFHDRMDDYPPIITSVSQIDNSPFIKIVATDYKHYDLSPPNDLIEPESNGIYAYQITNSSIEPINNWIKVNKQTTINQEIEIKDKGTWYIWVMDVGGNTTYKEIIINNIIRKVNDKPQIEATLNTTNFSQNVIINVNIKDEDNLKEYYIGKENIPTYTKINETKNFSYTYKVLDNGKYYIYAKDIYDNISETSIDVNNLDKESPSIESLFYENNYITVYATDNESGIDAYKIDNLDWSISNRFYIDKNATYQISVRDKAGNIITKEIVIDSIKDEISPITVPTEVDNEESNDTVIIILIVILVIIIIYLLFPKKKKVL